MTLHGYFNEVQTSLNKFQTTTAHFPLLAAMQGHDSVAPAKKNNSFYGQRRGQTSRSVNKADSCVVVFIAERQHTTTNSGHWGPTRAVIGNSSEHSSINSNEATAKLSLPLAQQLHGFIKKFIKGHHTHTQQGSQTSWLSRRKGGRNKLLSNNS